VAVGRPRKVETCDAVQSAIAAFWRTGYKATSLSDLETATGLTKGSLYKAFEDKHDLFVQALQMYIENAQGLIFEILERPGTALDQLSGWAELAVSNCTNGGCLAIKTSDELATEDPQVKQILIDYWRSVEQKLASVVERGQTEGAIRTDLPKESIVALLIRVAMGTAVAAPLTTSERNTYAFRTALELIKA